MTDSTEGPPRASAGVLESIRETVDRGSLSRRHLMELAGTAIPISLAGCMQAPFGSQDQAPGPSQRATTPLPGTLSLGSTSGTVGDTIAFEAGDLPANREVEVVWNTVQGSWGLIQDMNIVGPTYEPRAETMATASTDANGRVTGEWTVPEDYGGRHLIEVLTADGTRLAEAEYRLLSTFEIDRTSAPLGSTFTITSHALGPNQFASNYQLAWDNAYTGIFTAISSRGHAEATMRAAGPTGKHLIEVHRGYLGFPFLNPQQSPFGDVVGGRTHSWVVEVTEPEEEFPTAWSDPLRDTDPVPSFYPELDRQTDARMRVSPNSGTSGTEVRITGEAFPPNAEVNLVWYTISGSRVTTAPIEKVKKPDVLPTVTTDSNGAFEVGLAIPNDKGGTRPIVAEIDGESVAATGFVIQPEAVGLTVEEGPIGTDFMVEVSGIGWTEYGNTYAVVWDNQYLGYGCGMDERGGVVQFNLVAAGEPGPHFIDLYPSMYRADENPPDMYGGRAQLTHRYDHPGHPTPSLHFVFTVTE